jgi:uncharacterized LabA/DUF88 family protein
MRNPGYKKYIMFSSDTDYVPVLQRLSSKRKRSATLVDEHQPRVYTTYDYHADTVIPNLLKIP